MALPAIAIIGGGFSGAAAAYHLAARGARANILVFEPRDRLGAGLAYGTSNPAHRINVPAAKMSLIPEDPNHFVRWIAATRAVAGDPAALGPDGELYPARRVFGDYMAAQLAPFLTAGKILHIPERVNELRAGKGGWRVETADGCIPAALAVIATTHPPPLPPEQLSSALTGDSRFIADPLACQALARVPPSSRVLVVGTGLTAADVVATLDAQGHHGPITLISRHGLLSRGAAPSSAEPFGVFSTLPSATAGEVLRRIRAAIAAAAAQGRTWHAVLDAVRAEAPAFWPLLPVEERLRLVRHLRAFWDVHRFRIAPQPEGIIRRRLADGTLEVLAARVEQAAREAHSLLVTLRRRGSARLEARVYDVIVAATGPAHGNLLRSEPYLAALAASGWVRQDPCGLGLDCDRRARLISASGDPADTLFLVGPLARGTFGELMGLPEVARFAEFAASEILSQIKAVDGGVFVG